MKWSFLASVAFATLTIAYPQHHHDAGAMIGQSNPFNTGRIQPTYEPNSSIAATVSTDSTPSINTNSNNKLMSTVQSGASTGPDDGYPYSGKCNDGGLDQWRFNVCQCTSYVAYRLNQAGIHFDDGYDGVFWGNANHWDDATREIGLAVDDNPTVGSVAQTDEGEFGHVAWVAGVEGDEVQIEEYNFNGKLAYHTRKVNKGNFNYIHFG